jgi:hypothetical protein
MHQRPPPPDVLCCVCVRATCVCRCRVSRAAFLFTLRPSQPTTTRMMPRRCRPCETCLPHPTTLNLTPPPVCTTSPRSAEPSSPRSSPVGSALFFRRTVLYSRRTLGSPSAPKCADLSPTRCNPMETQHDSRQERGPGRMRGGVGPWRPWRRRARAACAPEQSHSLAAQYKICTYPRGVQKTTHAHILRNSASIVLIERIMSQICCSHQYAGNCTYIHLCKKTRAGAAAPPAACLFRIGPTPRQVPSSTIIGGTVCVRQLDKRLEYGDQASACSIKDFGASGFGAARWLCGPGSVGGKGKRGAFRRAGGEECTQLSQQLRQEGANESSWSNRKGRKAQWDDTRIWQSTGRAGPPALVHAGGPAGQQRSAVAYRRRGTTTMRARTPSVRGQNSHAG